MRYELSRILQEALRNVAQHAQASLVTVALTATRDRLQLRVSDNGHGFEVPADLAVLQTRDHHGIVGMYERARNIDGSLRVASAPGSGTTVAVTIPLVPTGSPAGR
jgi:signal transduction histidine kinase